ncbi:MAG: helix-turn-helix transcriptional regulator [Actinobacteria bacterium]|nr:MAG: helix-turn-helix transcriptional regulator [Actinomycetota bacterium]
MFGPMTPTSPGGPRASARRAETNALERELRAQVGAGTGPEDPISRAMEIVGDRWSLLIVREIVAGHRRFGELHRHLGIAKTVLSARLKALVAREILQPRPYHREASGRDWHEYRLTQAGIDLYPILIALQRWANTHLSDE